jgi:hypothetical protein
VKEHPRLHRNISVRRAAYQDDAELGADHVKRVDLGRLAKREARDLLRQRLSTDFPILQDTVIVTGACGHWMISRSIFLNGLTSKMPVMNTWPNWSVWNDSK